MGRKKSREREDAVLVLVNRTIELADELSAHPRLAVALDRDFGLVLSPHNEAGVVAVRIIQMWMGIEDPMMLRTGDSITLYTASHQPSAHYPLFDDGDEGATGGDRSDPQRARPPIEGEGTISPSKYATEAWKARAWETPEESTT